MEFKYLKTKRLRLRIVDAEVMDYVYSQYEDDELMAFFGMKNLDQLEEAKIKYKGGLSTHDRKFIKFLLIDQADVVIGDCGYHYWYIIHRRAEVGYSLFSDEVKRKGYMTEALAAVVEYGFSKMNLHRIEAMIGTDNIASQSLVKRLGFQFEGHLREHYFTNNRMEDSLVFGLLRKEYNSVP